MQERKSFLLLKECSNRPQCVVGSLYGDKVRVSTVAKCNTKKRPGATLAHWVYLVCAGVVLVVAYVVFMKKYYHLHEKYLESLKR